MSSSNWGWRSTASWAAKSSWTSSRCSEPPGARSRTSSATRSSRSSGAPTAGRSSSRASSTRGSCGSWSSSRKVAAPRSPRPRRRWRRRASVTSAVMTRYVIGPDVAIRLALDRAVIRPELQLLAPTLLRSQLLSSLYRAVRRGEMTKKDADEQLTYMRGLRLRLLGDRVLQNVAWKVAEQLGWSDTYDAEYVALTQLQADAFV